MTEPRVLRRFSIGPIKFLRRPVAEAPPEATICLVDDGDAQGFSKPVPGEFVAGVWSNGKGKPLPFQPTHWIVMDDGAGA